MMDHSTLKRFSAVYTNKLLLRAKLHPSEHARHILWMLKMIPDMAGTDKVARWFGFVQCYFWMEGLYTIDEMRAHVREWLKPFRGCRHPARFITFGPRTPLVHGSAATDICTRCGAYRTTHHKPGPWLEGPVDTGEES